MKILIILGNVVSPILMLLSQRHWSKLRLLFNVIAVFAALVFAILSSLSIHNIIKNETVFMTNIHGIFLNPFFLLAGAYLGIFIIYRLLIIATSEI